MVLKLNLLAAAVFALSSGSAFAIDAQTSDVRVFYVDESLDDGVDDIDGDGFGLGANVVLPGGLLIPIEYSRTEYDFDVELENLRVGVGYSFAVGPVSAVSLGARYHDYTLEGPGGELTLDGYGVFLAGKAVVSPSASLYGEINYQFLEEDSAGEDVDGFEFAVGASYDLGGPGVFAEYRLSKLEDDFDNEFELSGFRVGVLFGF